MKKYDVKQYYTKVDYWYDIEAKDKSEAIEKAMSLEPNETEFADDTETEVDEVKN